MINNDQDGGEDVAVVRALSLPLTLPLALPSVSRTTGSGRAQGRPGQCRHTFTHTHTMHTHTHTHRLLRRRRLHNVRVVGRSALRGTSFLAATAEAETEAAKAAAAEAAGLLSSGHTCIQILLFADMYVHAHKVYMYSHVPHTHTRTHACH